MANVSATTRKRTYLEGLVQVLSIGDEPHTDRESPGNPGAQSSGRRLHQPVLLEEAIESLAVKPAGVYLDVTVGTAGHARAILARLGPEGLLVGVDRDAEVLEVARRQLEGVRSAAQFVLQPGDFAAVDGVCEELGVGAVDGVLADLGMSSWQLESAERGFSHAAEGPLDMRFDRQQRAAAADLIERYSEAQLAEVFFRYGEEPFSRRIARAIVRRRRQEPIRTTTQLAEVVRSAVPPRARAGALARTFQALRLALNRELESLDRFLKVVPRLLAPGGRLVVISFHSLEDGRVKRALREGQRAGILRRLSAKPVRPTEEEVARNPRSRSARLRAAEKLVLTGLAAPQGGDR